MAQSGSNTGLVTFKGAGDPVPQLELLRRTGTLGTWWDLNAESSLDPKTWVGARLQEQPPSWAQGHFGPHSPPAPVQTGKHVRTSGKLVPQADSRARTSGNTCSPPWEWRPASPEGGRGGRRGPEPPLRKWAADVATPRRPQLVWMGPRALGSPGMRFPHRLSPQPLAGPPSVSLSSSLLPLSQPRGAFRGAGWEGERRSLLRPRLGGLERAPAWQPLLQA